MSPPIRRRIFALALTGLFVVPWAASAGERLASKPRSQRPAVQGSAALLDQLLGSLKAIWGRNGCSIDPDGARCASNPHSAAIPVAPAPTVCSLDPSGACAAWR